MTHRLYLYQPTDWKSEMASNKLSPWWVCVSILVLIVTVTALSLAFGWFEYKLNHARKQASAVEAICFAGGQCAYDFDPEIYSTPDMGFFRGRFRPDAPEWLVSALGVDFVARVQGVTMPASTGDEMLAHLASLPNVEIVDLSRASVRAPDLRHLEALTQLSTIRLSGISVRDEHLKDLPALPNLRALDLYGTRITDRGIEQLLRFRTIRYLHLDGTSTITDASLELLAKLPDLRELTVWNTRLTVSALIQFDRLTPECVCAPPYCLLLRNGQEFSEEELQMPVSELPGYNRIGRSQPDLNR
jgi:hypothetical protein